MLNVIRMELVRMFRSRAFYVVLLSVIFYTAFSFCMNYAPMLETPANYAYDYSEEEGMSKHDGVGIIIDMPSEIFSENREATLTDFIETDFQSRFMLLFIAVFAALFTGAEYSSGFVKNIGSQIRYRSGLIISKLAAVILFVILLFLVYGLTAAISGKVFIGYFHLGDLNTLLRTGGVQLLMHVVFGVLVSCFTYLIRNTAAGVTVGMLVAVNIMSFFYGAVNTFVQETLGYEEFSIGAYTLLGNVSAIYAGAGMDLIRRAIMVSLFYLLIVTGVTSFVVEKRDI